jgi:hypothetical protein
MACPHGEVTGLLYNFLFCGEFARDRTIIILNSEWHKDTKIHFYVVKTLGVGAYNFRIPPAEHLFVIQKEMADIMLVSWQPPGTDAHYRRVDVLFRV